MSDELQMRLFGGLQITREGRPLVDFVSNKVPALLAYLAVTRRIHQREALAALLWGEMPDSDSKNNLRQALSNLRKLAAPHVEITRETVQFNPQAAYFLDIETFLQEVHPDPHQSVDEHIARLKQAAALYAGDFLQGFFVRDAPEYEEWMLGQRARCRELAMQALHTLARLYIACGETAFAIHTVTRLLALDPWREEAHRQLMLLQARGGQPSAALKQYELCRKILARELGVEPSVETTSLYERIRSALVQPGGNLSEHTPGSALVGRETELDEITRRLLNPECRLLTLNGMGGSGKTRLALEAARRQTGAFLNGVYFVPLADMREADRLIPAIAGALHYPLKSGITVDALLNFLRKKELLLVLDDFEHLANSQPCLQLVIDLLKQAPEVKLLITSRQRLNLRQEWVYDVGGLEQPDALALFVQSARQVASGFSATPEDEKAMVRICQAVGGLPLGIGLAAAWRRAMTCGEIAAELEKNTIALSSPALDMPARHRSLQAVFDHSWDMLTPAEQCSLADMAVFSGGFTRPAAQAVAGAADPILASLVDKSFIQIAARGRFSLHDLVRQYATVRQTAPLEVEGRHAGYYADFTQARQDLLRRGAHQQQAIEEILQEADNMRQMWSFALKTGQSALFEKAVTGFYMLCETSGRLREGGQMLAEAAAGLEDSPQNQWLRGRLLVYQASLLGATGQYDPARQIYRQGLMAAEQAGDVSTQALATRSLGFYALMRGSQDEALQLVSSGLQMYRSINHLTGIGEALISVGVVLANRGEYEAARRSHQEALDLAEEIQDEFGRSAALDGLGTVAYLTHHLEQARRYYQASYEIQRAHNYLRGRAISIHNIACIACDLKEWPEALQAQQEALDILSDLGHQEGIMHCRHNLARIMQGMEKWAEARRNLGEALQIGVQLNAIADTLDCCLVGVEMLYRQGRALEALRILDAILPQPGAYPYTLERGRVLETEITASRPAGATRNRPPTGQRPVEEIAADLAVLLEASA